MKKALLLVNQHARSGQKLLSQATRELQALGFELIQESTDSPHHIPDAIQRYKNQVDLVIIGGGDGTLNAAIEGLIKTDLPLGILPLGTANDLARTLGIPTSLPEACQVIAAGQIRRIDLGWVNGKYFFNVASLGLSVQITQRLTKEVKRRWGILAYAATALQVIWQSRPFRAEIRVNNQSIRVKTIQIAIGNGRYYGGGMTVAEDATIDDQRLDLYSLETKHWWQIVALLPAMRQGNHASWPGVRALHGQEIEVRTSKSRRINTDGEITTHTPAIFRVIPKALAVFAP
ncbi:lipid kinase [Kamptonema animale CS-326]|jgi:diacylglycerol kinase (ATP)|uniref:lipid kinase n=1 Tax=Kamptonema animale TaxID=92934 RepID=UPI00232AE1A0|nr:lipid kinase [Kamptonema animale]MDB9510002.1 lipid kinase [Kamptonema animale CS-326]